MKQFLFRNCSSKALKVGSRTVLEQSLRTFLEQLNNTPIYLSLIFYSIKMLENNSKMAYYLFINTTFQYTLAFIKCNINKWTGLTSTSPGVIDNDGKKKHISFA